MWRGWVRTERIAEYVDIVERTGMAGYRATPGNAGAQLLTRDLGGGRTELVTLSWWSSMRDVLAFAGEDVDVARYYPEDDEFLLERETTVSHFDVAPAEHAEPDASGFTMTRVVPGDPASVFAHFTEPEAFARWFVVAGWSTPAERLRLDVRPGGAVAGVLVADPDGTEVAFTAAYGRIDAPHTVQLAFADPTETVTVSLLDLGAQGTQVTYRNDGAPIQGRAQAIGGVARMLDALAASVAAGGIDGGAQRG